MALVLGGLDLTAFDFAMKELYTDPRIYALTYKKNPLLARLQKYEKFGGRQLPLPVVYGRPTGRSATFATGQTNISPTDGVEFILKRKKDYGFVRIDHETLMASKDDPASFLRAKSTEIDGILETLGRSLAIALYGNGSGVRGQVDASTTLGSTSLLLRDISTVVYFEKDMVIRLSAANDGTGAVRAGSLQITKVNRQTGLLTVDQNINAGIAAATVNDYISIDGDYANMLSGLDGWIPTTDPSATTFFGVDRTPDVTRLSGVRMDLSGWPLEEAVIELVNRVEREGGAPDEIYMNYAQFRALEKAQSSKVFLTDPEKDASANIGFRYFSVNGQNGPVKIIPDANCPNNRMYCLTMDTFTLYSLGRAPTLYDTDGLTMLRAASTDDVDIRCYYYAQLGCRAPGYNGVAILTPA